EVVVAGRSDDPDAWLELGGVAFEMGDRERAAQALEKLIAADQQDPVGLGKRARLLLLLGQPEEALACVTPALEAEACARVRGWLHSLAAEAYHDLGNTAPARRHLEAAVAADAEEPAHWNRLGWIRSVGGDLGVAREALERAIELGTDDSTAYAN